MRGLFLSVFFIFNIYALDINVSNTQIKNGQTALVKFSKSDNIVYNYITIKDKKYKIFSDYAYIPVSYYEEPKDLKVKVSYTQDAQEKTKEISFKVVDAHYKKETLSVDPKRVNLSKEDKKRASLEYKEAIDIYNNFSDKNYINSKFIMPIDSKITSEFGRARVFNGTLKSYHSGTDFRAKVGTPIKSANSGKVVLVKNRFYAGGSIIIDHGHGVYTCYYHMSKFNVKENELVKKGQIIGLSGVSGRATGPHLHFSARVSGVQVDPLQFINLINKEL